jgi:protein-L-isoaspartate(D-aspartate) O-methyltransferase
MERLFSASPRLYGLSLNRHKAPPMPVFAALRRNMVDTQLRTSDVTDPRILHAMGEVPREIFVPPAKRSTAYAERCVEVGKGRVILDPRCFAKLVQAAGIEDADNVLDVGCGSGYSTAVIARLAAYVMALEEDAALLQTANENLRAVPNATLVNGPLAAGWAQSAPYEVILLNGAVDFVPKDLFAQLSEDGRLVCIVRTGASGQAVVHTRHNGAIGDRPVFDANAPVLPGFRRRQGFVF